MDWPQTGASPRLRGMVRELVPDASWQRVAPLLPPPRPKKKLGRPRADDRAALEAIVFVLRCSPPLPRPARPCLSVRPFPKQDDDGVGVREGWRGRQGRADRAVECPGWRGDRPRRRRGDRRLRHRLPLRGLAASSRGARCPRTRPRALVAVLLRAVSLLPRASFRASAAPGVRRLHQGLGGAGLPPGDVTTRR